MNSLISRTTLTAFFTLAVGPFVSAQEYEPATTTFPSADPDGEIIDSFQPALESEKSFDVHLHNGEFFVEQTDLTIAGRGFDFEWKRYYRSRANLKGPLGYNWDHSYNIYIEQDGTDLILHDGDFREDRFIPTATPDVWGAPGQFRTIYLNTNGTYTVVLRRNSKWIMHSFDGSKLAGKAMSIIDRNGNVMLLEYSGRTGQLIRIKDTLHEDTTNERVIHIRYNQNGYIKEIEDFCTDLGIGGDGRKVKYTYYTGGISQSGEKGDLESVRSPVVVGTSNGNDFPNGKTWMYTYITGSAESELQHNLLTVQDPKGQYPVINGYYTGFPSAYVFDRVVRQRIGDAAGPQFNYSYSTQVPSAANNNATHLTIVNDRSGNVCELYYEGQFLSLVREFSGRAPNAKILTSLTSNRPVNPLRPVGDPIHDPDPAFWETKVSTNADGLVSELVLPNGKTVSWCYDSDNLFARSRANLSVENILPGIGTSLDNDGFLLKAREWSFVSIFNLRATFLDYRNKLSGFTFDGPGLEGPLGGCSTPPVNSIGDTTSSRSASTHKQFLITPKLESIDPWFPGEVPAPPPGVVYSAGPDNSSGQPGENGGIEPNSLGGGCGTGQSCPAEGAAESVSSESLLLLGCDCYSYEVNAAGQRVSKTDPEGMVTEYEYYTMPPMMGHLRKIIRDAGPAGSQLATEYQYNLAGHVTSFTDPKGHVTMFELNALGQVVRETGPAPMVVERVRFYDANNNLIQVDVENVESLYNLMGVVEHLTVTANPWISTTYTHDSLNDILSEENEVDSLTSVTREFNYDENQNLAQVRMGEAVNGNQPFNTINLLWDERDLLFEKTFALGSLDVTTEGFDYDVNRNLSAKHEGIEAQFPRRIDLLWNGHDLLKDVVDPMGNRLLIEYDEAGNATKRSWLGEYVDIDGGVGNVLLREIGYQWDDRNLLEVTDVSHFWSGGGPTVSAEFRNEYNDVEQVTARIDALLRRTDVVYDSAHRFEQVEDPLFNSYEVISYDENSNPLFISQLDQSSFSSLPSSQASGMLMDYDELNRLIRRTDNALNVERFGYDSRGNLVQVIDKKGREVRYSFDGLNRLTATIVDMNDNGAMVSDTGDIVTLQEWDDTSRLIALTDDSGNVTRFAYDATGRWIVRRMDDGSLYQMGTGAIWPIGTAAVDLTNFTSGYDPHGNALLRTDANGTSTNSVYDGNNRIASRTINRASLSAGDPVDVLGTTFENYSFDGLGRIVRLEDDDSVVMRAYDSMNNLVSESIEIDGDPAQTTTRLYDVVGNEVSTVYPGSRVVTTGYDGLNRKDSINSSAVLEQFHYLGRSKLEARVLGDQSLISSYQFDYTTNSVHSPKGIIHEDGVQGSLESQVLSWDAVGNQKLRTSTLSGKVHDFSYDDAYRLTSSVVSELTPRGNELNSSIYTLDGVHNREQVARSVMGGMPTLDMYSMAAASPLFDFEQNQYTSTPIDSRVYDLNGNWIEKRDVLMPSVLLASISYDAFNRMVEYSENGGPTHKYSYDGYGRRIAKIVDANGSAVETRFFYGGPDNWHVIEEQDATGATLATYIYGNGVDELVAMEKDADGQPGLESYYYLLNEQNSTTAIVEVNTVSNTASLLERYEFKDFGTPAIFDSLGAGISSSGIANPYMFTGRRFDEETGLYQFRTRYLDPEVGRFTSRDSIGIWGDKTQLGNGYSYAANNPASKMDPYGLQAVDVGGGPPNPPSPSDNLRDSIDSEVQAGETPEQAIDRLGHNVIEMGGVRYVECSDGTVIDLRHFVAAADTAGDVGEGITNILGWGNEVSQWVDENWLGGNGDSGHPFGGNEDLTSNADGADVGDEHLGNDGSLGDQVVDYIEAEHGEVTGLHPNGPAPGTPPPAPGTAQGTGDSGVLGSNSSGDSNSSQSNSSSTQSNVPTNSSTAGTNSGAPNSNAVTEVP